MPSFLDFMERALKGPIVSEKEFDMKILVPAIRNTVKEFDIRYERENPVSSENELADRLFNGAIELLTRTGIYCLDTSRIIQFDRKEIEGEFKGFTGKRAFGEGRERSVFGLRSPEDKKLPWFHVGTGIVASSAEVAMAQVEGYGSIEKANSISIPAISDVNGISVSAGSPLEIYAAIESIQAGRSALRRCGRPGLPIMNLISSAATAIGTIAGTYPAFGLRKSDGWLIDPLAEMKTNYDTLNQVAFLHNTGGNIGSTGSPVFGGYAGGAEGSALLMTAYFLIGQLFFKGSYHLSSVIHFRYGCNTTSELLWVFSVVGRATSRNMRYPSIGLGYAAAGPCTKMYFYEAAGVNLCCVASGYGGVQTVHPARAVITDGVTPMEALFNVEVATAVAGMKADEANEIVLKLLERYEKNIENASKGKVYQECYDLKTKKPNEDYIKLYNEVKEELSGMGIPFQF